MALITETTDAASGISTIYELTEGDSFAGQANAAIDTDSVKVSLTAGVTYGFQFITANADLTAGSNF